MEESLNWEKEVREGLELKETDIRTYSPLALAFIGDAVYEVLIRSLVLSEGNMPVDKLHRKTVAYVKAGAQSHIVKGMQPLLTEEEGDICRRGRNTQSHSVPKNADPGDYRRATGLEALMGWLYLQGRMERAIFLVREGIEAWKKDENTEEGQE